MQALSTTTHKETQSPLGSYPVHATKTYVTATLNSNPIYYALKDYHT
jgi:hypothetical protein